MLLSGKSLQYAVYVVLGMQIITQTAAIPVSATSAMHSKHAVARRDGPGDVSDAVLGALNTKIRNKLQKISNIGKNKEGEEDKKINSVETKAVQPETAPANNAAIQSNQFADETLSAQGNVEAPVNQAAGLAAVPGNLGGQGNLASSVNQAQGSVIPQGSAGLPQGGVAFPQLQ